MSRLISGASSLREQQAQAAREGLLDAAMTLIEAGEEPTMRAIAKTAGVSERTIYRYFESHEALATALRPRFIGRSGVPLCEHADELPAYAESLFSTFEANRELIVALVTSSWARPHLERSRARNLAALRRLLDQAHPEAEPFERAAAASALRLTLSGQGWYYLRIGCDQSARTVIRHAQWLIDTTRARLRAPSP